MSALRNTIEARLIWFFQMLSSEELDALQKLIDNRREELKAQAHHISVYFGHFSSLSDFNKSKWRNYSGWAGPGWYWWEWDSSTINGPFDTCGDVHQVAEYVRSTKKICGV